MPDWATALQAQVTELAGVVAKLPETTVNAVREATQPAKQPPTPRARAPRQPAADPPPAAPAPTPPPPDGQQPGRRKTFAERWFGD